MRRTAKIIPFKKPKRQNVSPLVVALMCPLCGDVRYFPKGEEYYVDENGRRSVRRCAKCPS